MAAPKENRYNQKYSKEQAIDIFEAMLEKVKNDPEILSIQDAYLSTGLPRSSFYNLCELHKELDNIKAECNDIIIARINKQALHSNFNSTASIWRMKQLGEKDEQYNNNYNSNTSKLTIDFGGKEFSV